LLVLVLGCRMETVQTVESKQLRKRILDVLAKDTHVGHSSHAKQCIHLQ
jgi:hypothetical protein